MTELTAPRAVLEARELTDAQAKKLIRKAFAFERAVKVGITGANASFWKLAEALYGLSELRGWELLGYDTLEEFLGQPDVGLKRSTYFHAVRMWRDLAVVKEVSPARLADLPPSKVQEVVPAIMRGDIDVDRGLDDAQALSKSDLRERYATPGDPDKPPPTVKATCPTCGTRVNAEVLEAE